jgi:hypothetical protein
MIQKVEFLADGMSLGVITAPPWTFTVPAGRLPDGAHVLAAKATDPSNNTATSPVVHVTVANVNGSGGSGGQAGSGGSGGSGGQMGGNSGVEGGCACDVGGGHTTGSWALFGLGVLIVTGSRRRIGRRRAR